MGCFGPPKAVFSRPLDIVTPLLWTASTQQETCLASKREKTVKRVNMDRMCSSRMKYRGEWIAAQG